MASDLASAVLKAVVTLTHTNAPDLLSTASDPLNQAPEVNLTSGAGANQADQAFHTQLTIASGANSDLDLNGAALQNIFGEDLAFLRIKGIYLKNTSDDNIILIGGGSNVFINWVGAAGDIVQIRAGGFMLLVAPDATGYEVTAATGDILRIADDGSASGSATVDVVLIGSNS